jgi:Ca-activated chloride channel family protein
MDRRPVRLRAAAAASLAVALATGAGAQVFRGGTDLVLLNVTVQDTLGRLVPDLAREDFQVFEDGVLQTVQNFSREMEPIALSILIDTSASMDRKLATAQEAAVGFLRRLTPHDLAMIIDFDAQARIRQSFTNDRVALEGAIRSTRAGGPTALYNAIYTAVNELRVARAQAAADDPVRRQAIVVLSDGEDTNSLIDDVAVLDALQRSEVALYAVGLRATAGKPDDRSYQRAEAILLRMARQTGGRAYFVSQIEELRGVYAQIADELASQYTIGYVSTNTARDGAWRAVQIVMKPANTMARTRAGYFAPRARE